MTTKKRILICGAGGFLGKNLFDAFFNTLSPRADLEICGTYLTNGYRRINPDDPRLIRADLTKEEEVDRVLGKGFDVVIQLAANSSSSKDDVERPEIHVTPNMAMNNWLIAAAHRHQVSQFIFQSCTVMYPNQDPPSLESDVDLNRDFSPVQFGGAWMKVASEKLCLFFSRLGITKFTVIRPSNIYGPGDRFDPDRSHVFAATIRKVAEAKDGNTITVWGQGKEVRDFFHVYDFARFVELVIDNQDYSFDIFNLGSEEPVSIDELVKRVIRISGKNLRIEYNPNGPTVGNKISINCSKARNKFGWKTSMNLDEGIKSTLKWYEQNVKSS